MATPVLARPEVKLLPEDRLRQERRRYAVSLITGLTAAALVIHGFHPFAEDGGLYLAGVKRVLDPTLYAGDAEFVLGHLRFSLFAPVMAWLVKTSQLDLETLVLLVHLFSIWLTLAGAWMLAGRCFRSLTQRTCAVALLAVWLTLPIAGTSLMLMDPYVTARSISTPMTVFALVGSIDFLRSSKNSGRWNWTKLGLTVLALFIAAMMHPLMAGYGLACILALGATLPESRNGRIIAASVLAAAAVVAATVLRLAAQAESISYRDVAMSRYYWFLSQWHWYELIGALAPLTILGYVAWTRRNSRATAQHEIASMGLLAGSIAIIIALIYAQVGASNHLVARMQPMRTFQLVYIVMIVLVGGGLGRVLGKSAIRWGVTFGALILVMASVERVTFPASERIEVDLADVDDTPANSWVQAFEWIRKNTPKSALFALDADYITKPGEDAQSFRAIAERSALPDYSKDGGEAAITPTLTDQWKAGQTAQERLSDRNDADRLAALKSRHVDWVVLEQRATTSFVCEYTNAQVKVCRLPNTQTDSMRVSLRPPVAAPSK